MDLFSIIVPAVAVAAGLYFLYRMWRHGGLRGAMFGARVVRSLGDITAEQQGPMRVLLKVHVLEGTGSERLVGIELVAKSVLSYQTVPATLRPQQALALATALQEAAQGQ